MNILLSYGWLLWLLWLPPGQVQDTRSKTRKAVITPARPKRFTLAFWEIAQLAWSKPPGTELVVGQCLMNGNGQLKS